jgi:hypothetical protein
VRAVDGAAGIVGIVKRYTGFDQLVHRLSAKGFARVLGIGQFENSTTEVENVANAQQASVVSPGPGVATWFQVEQSKQGERGTIILLARGIPSAVRMVVAS